MSSRVRQNVTVTNTVGEYRKLARTDHNPGEHHVYQDSPEPESIKAACMPLKVLIPSCSRPHSTQHFSPLGNHQQWKTPDEIRASIRLSQSTRGDAPRGFFVSTIELQNAQECGGFSE